MNHRTAPTTEEIVNTLKRTNIPTIVIEGDDDLFVYRWLKKQTGGTLVSLLPCGGRKSLFKVYERREEFNDSNVVFIADKDFYRFTGIPSDKDDIIFTTGYCIENDLYDGSNIEEFLDYEDKSNHELLLDVVIRWFSSEVEKYFEIIEQGKKPELSIKSHINIICPLDTYSLCPNFAEKISYKEPRNDILSMIKDEYPLNVRGKQLFQILARFMSKKGRFSQFKDKHLIEIALKQGNNNHLQRMIETVSAKLEY